MTLVFCHYSPMMSRRLVIALASASLLLTSCAAGGQAPTRNIKQVTDGVDKDAGELKIRNLLVVATPGGGGTLVAYIVNQGNQADQLAGLTINGQTAELTTSAPLTTNKPMIFEGEVANAKAKVAALGAVAGARVPVVLYFAKAGKVELDALIVENSGIYSSIL
jgi:copper(I)-binding protein